MNLSFKKIMYFNQAYFNNSFWEVDKIFKKKFKNLLISKFFKLN